MKLASVLVINCYAAKYPGFMTEGNGEFCWSGILKGHKEEQGRLPESK